MDVVIISMHFVLVIFYDDHKNFIGKRWQVRTALTYNTEINYNKTCGVALKDLPYLIPYMLLIRQVNISYFVLIRLVRYLTSNSTFLYALSPLLSSLSQKNFQDQGLQSKPVVLLPSYSSTI